jgi:hypothetical protein
MITQNCYFTFIFNAIKVSPSSVCFPLYILIVFRLKVPKIARGLFSGNISFLVAFGVPVDSLNGFKALLSCC